MYERELELVSQNSQKHIDELELENNKFRLKQKDWDMKKEIDKQVDQGTSIKTKNILESTKSELESASAIIK